MCSERRLKIAFLTPRFPFPPDRGDRVTVLNMLRALSSAHDVTLVAYTDGSEPPDATEQVSRFCARVATIRLSRWRSWTQAWLGLGSSIPSQVSYYRSARMQALVEQTLRERSYDVVVAHTIRMAPFVLNYHHPVKVLWVGDSLGLVLRGSLPHMSWWKRIGVEWEARRVDRFEGQISRSFVEIRVISPADLADMIRIGCRNVVMIPHGVDERLFDLEHRPSGEPRIVFLGNLSVPHNVDAAVFAVREIWPQVRAAFPGARLILAGASPVSAVRKLRGVSGVEVTGALPDLSDVWQRAHAMLAPLRFSTGIQNKVLEAMAAGVPVVTTSPVAEAIGARHLEHVLAADGAHNLGEALIGTLREPAAAEARAQRARELVRQNFNWTAEVRRLEQLAASARPAERWGAVSGL